MEGVMILSAILTAIAFLAGFLTGIRAGERAGRAEERALLYEAIQEVFLKTPEDGEAEAGGTGEAGEKERLDAIWENINAYDGSSAGQKEVK